MFTLAAVETHGGHEDEHAVHEAEPIATPVPDLSLTGSAAH